MTPGQVKAGIPAPSIDGSDNYDTPYCATAALMTREDFSGPIWEPACGRGFMVHAINAFGHTTICTDIAPDDNDIFPRPDKLDFLTTKSRLAPNLVTNPPFSILTKWMIKCQNMGFEKYALLIPITALSGRERLAKVYGVNPPGKVWVFANRIPFRRRDYHGKLAPLGMHAWAVWSQADTGRTELCWINDKMGI